MILTINRDVSSLFLRTENWTPYIAKEHLGVAKDNWGVDELKQMIDNDSLFVDNCIKYRDKLTSKHSSKMLVDIFEERNKNR